MAIVPERLYRRTLWEPFKGISAKIAEINEKYATPRIKMSRGVKVSLLLLRLYLLFLVILLGYKFVTVLKGGF